eukprot:GSChrysophyteH2.ASY1.ANO1.208.1 assembled CDS
MFLRNSLTRLPRTLSLRGAPRCRCPLRSTHTLTNTPTESSSTEPGGLFAEKTPITRQLWKKRQEHAAQEDAENKAAAAAAAQQRTTTGGSGSAAAKSLPLVEKAPSHSRVDVTYNFRDDTSLRETYQDSQGLVLMEKFLEDLDALAGNVAFWHADDGLPATSPLALVTASVEEIRVLRQMDVQSDIVLSGQVVYVRASVSVPSLIEAAGDATRVLSSVFTYVARDKSTGKSARVNPLCQKEMSETEVTYFAQRAAAVAQRKQLLSKPESNGAAASANAEEMAEMARERDAMVAMVDKGKAMVDMPALAHPDRVLISSTALENAFVTQPQKSNTSGNVFGGFLLHQAAALASVNKIVFQKAVHIGDLVRLRSRVSYVSPLPQLQGGMDTNANSDANAGAGADARGAGRRACVVDITCHIVKPERFSSELSNRFSFVFDLQDSSHSRNSSSSSRGLRLVQPSTKEEVLALAASSRSVHGASSVFPYTSEVRKRRLAVP